MEKLTKNILVIGGSGFIGDTLIPSLLKEGFDVSVLNRGNKIMKGTTQLIADRTNPLQIQKVAMEVGNFDVIIDTSSYNLQSTEVAWNNFSNKTSHWIHLSSAAVYKETPGRFPNENDDIGGAQIWGDYGIEKSEADQFLINHSGETSVTILRPPYLYGPGNDNDRETFIWTRVLKGRKIIIPSNGETQIQFLYIKDLVNAIEVIMNNKPKKFAVYNVGAKERLTLSEWVNIASHIAGISNPGILSGVFADKFRPRQYFPFRDYPCCVEVSLIRQELDWHSKYSLESGLLETFETYNFSSLKTNEIETTIEDQILKSILTQSKN